MLVKIIRDAYTFFDRRWALIVGAALLVFGIAYAALYTIEAIIHMPDVTLGKFDGKPLSFNYEILFEFAILSVASFGFDAFIASIARSEIDNTPLSTGAAGRRAITRFPMVIAANIAAQILVLVTALWALPAITLFGGIGVLFIIPALVLSFRLSLMTFVVVVDGENRLASILKRSILLTSGFLLMIFAVKLLTVLPVFATAGIEPATGTGSFMSGIYIKAADMFIGIATAIMSAVVMTSTYLNLRLVKGERLNGSVWDIAKESAEA